MENSTATAQANGINRELVAFNDIIGDIKSGKLGIDPNNGGRTPIHIGSEGIFSVSPEMAAEITKLSGSTNGNPWNVTLLTGGEVVITNTDDVVGEIDDEVAVGETVEGQSLSLNATVLKWYPGLADLKTVADVNVKVRCIDLELRSASPRPDVVRPALEAVKPEVNKTPGE